MSWSRLLRSLAVCFGEIYFISLSPGLPSVKTKQKENLHYRVVLRIKCDGVDKAHSTASSHAKHLRIVFASASVHMHAKCSTRQGRKGVGRMDTSYDEFTPLEEILLFSFIHEGKAETD